ncbi:MAG: hypothetical protein IJW79_00345 [Clostridia bacterium]|nr:hypothetical protein [Clostridia bacterium]
MKIFEKRYCENIIGCWYEYYLFGIKIHKKIIFLYRYYRTIKISGIGIDIVAIALNEEYHFGQKMLERLDKPVQAILDEMTTYKDMEVLAARIA